MAAADGPAPDAVEQGPAAGRVRRRSTHSLKPQRPKAVPGLDQARAGRAYVLDYWRDDMRWGALLIDKAFGQTLARGIPESIDMEPAEKDRARKQFVPPTGAAGLYVFRHEHMGNTHCMRVNVTGQSVKMGDSAPCSRWHVVDASKGQKGVMASRLAVTR